MEYKNQIYTKDGAVATIMFNRPERRNSHDIESYTEFQHAMRAALGDSAIRVIVLTGAGTAWSAGRDIKFTNRATPQEIAQYQSILGQVYDLVRTCDKPVIARINGPITGGTNRLAFECCDVSIAVNTARFARREINTGLSGGAAHFHAIGRNLCIDMNLTGRFISADEAQQWGLLTRSVPPDKLDEVVQDYIEMLVKLPP